MNKFSRTARSVTFAAIVGLSLGVSAPGAFAQDERPQVVAQASGNIDFTKEGSIHIHKRIGVEGKSNRSGLEWNKAFPGEQEPGQELDESDKGKVTFQIEKVVADLTTNGGLEKAAKLTAAEAQIDQGFAAVKKTVAQGADFTGLKIGVYKVTEIVDPSLTGLVPAQPFLVFVPTTNPTGNGWNYDVHVYPKNSKVDVEKKVKDDDVQAGQQITYTVDGQAPQFNKVDKKLTKFWFEDQLDKRVNFTKEDAEVKVNKANGQTLASSDFEVSITPEENKDSQNAQKLTVKLTTQGLEKVEPGEKLSLVFKVKVLPLGENGASDIKNSARVITNNPNGGNDIENKTNEVVTYYGKLKIVKKDANGDKPLSGAKFSLHYCNGKIPEQQLSVEGKKEFITDDSGTVTIDGLHVTDIADNTSDVSPHQYCLVETEAPAGYAKNVEPTLIDLFTKEKIAGAPLKTVEVEIKNVRQETPELPLTGGAGVGILAAIGAAIIGAGAWFARRNSAEA